MLIVVRTFVVRVMESTDGRLRGVAERVGDERSGDAYTTPFSDAEQLIGLLTCDDSQSGHGEHVRSTTHPV